LKKRIISIVCLFLLISLLPGCSSDKEDESDAIIVNDQIGRQITIKDQVKRVVSTSYITTSTCLALGVVSWYRKEGFF
jgi:iron complex transport system substrate-binding protein